MSRIAPTALYQEVAERLRQRIYAHDLAPGSWIDEQAIAEGYGISRTPLREALKVLVAEGLVTLKPRRGCYVTEISERDLDEIFPLMGMLEGRAAHDVALKAGAREMDRLTAIHQELESAAAANNRESFFDANQRFHAALLEISGNRWLANVIGDLRKFLKLTRHDSLSATGRLQASLLEHRAILAALQKKDADAADQAMRAHLAQGRQAVASVLKQARS